MKKIFLFFAAGLLLTSCSDLLDTEPYDQFTKQNYFTSETNVQLFANYFYNTFTGYGSGSGDYYFNKCSYTPMEVYLTAELDKLTIKGLTAHKLKSGLWEITEASDDKVRAYLKENYPGYGRYGVGKLKNKRDYRYKP